MFRIKSNCALFCFQSPIRGDRRAVAIRQPGRGAVPAQRGEPGAGGVRRRAGQQLLRTGARARTGWISLLQLN